MDCRRESAATSSLHDLLTSARPKLTTCFTSITDSIRKTYHAFVQTSDETSSDASTIPLAGYAPRRSRLFCVPGNEFRAQRGVIAATPSSGACVATLHEGGVHGPEFTKWFPQPAYPSRYLSVHGEHRAPKSIHRAGQRALAYTADSELDEVIAQSKRVLFEHGTGHGIGGGPLGKPTYSAPSHVRGDVSGLEARYSSALRRKCSVSMRKRGHSQLSPMRMTLCGGVQT